MNAPIQALYSTGQALYAVLVSNDDGTVWNDDTQEWEAYNSGHWAQYAVPLTEYASSGYYRATYPIATPTFLSSDMVFLRGGSDPALGDSPVTAIMQSQGANIAAIGQLVGGANGLALTTNGMVIGAVAAGAATSSAFYTDLTSTVNSAYQGRVCLFVNGDLINQVGNVIGYDGATKLLTVGGPYTSAPSEGDSFIII